MAWNGAGTFARVYSWVSRAANPATKYIDATSMDAEFDNFKTGLENCITRSGETTPTANQAMAGYRHTGVGAASALTDYARAGEVQKGTIFRAASPGGTIDAMTATMAPAPSLTAGQIVSIIAYGTGSNTVTTPTLALNGGSAITIRKNQTALVAGDYTAGDTLLLVYDGTYFELLNPKYPVLNNPHSGFTTDSTGGATDDLIPFIDTSDSSADNKVTVSDFFKNVYANVSAKAAPIAADSLTFADSAASGAVKRATFTELFTSLLGLFTAKSAPILADTVMIADSAASGAPKISTWQQVFNAISLTTAKTTLASGDKIHIGDSAASDVAKHITWANAKTQLLTDLTATEAEMEAATSTTKVLTPANARHHPGIAKFWVYATVSGGVPAITASHNVTSVSDNATGETTVTIDTDFASGAWCCVTSVEEVASPASGSINTIDGNSLAAGSVIIFSWQTGASSNATKQDPGAYHVVGFGAQ